MVRGFVERSDSFVWGKGACYNGLVLRPWMLEIEAKETPAISGNLNVARYAMAEDAAWQNRRVEG